MRESASRAALGNYDVKTTKRVPLKDLEKETDFSTKVELLRRKHEKSKLVDDEDHKVDDESILSEKRLGGHIQLVHNLFPSLLLLPFPQCLLSFL